MLLTSSRRSGVPNSVRCATMRKGSQRISLERLEQRTLLAAIPTTALTLPTQALIGETLNFTVGFSNTSLTSTGFGPYVDLFLPTTGLDGVSNPDGVSFNSASYLGSAIVSTTLTFDAGGHATHPYARDNTGSPVVVSGTPGDQLVVLQLPFGSYTPGQTTATINVTTRLSNFADVGESLNITTRGGFRYGNDALDNPTTDPTLIGTSTTAAVTPTLFILKKTYIGPEDETATGPNFPRQDLITVDVAAGQTITNLDLTDVLPNSMQYVQVDATTIRGTATSTTSVSTPSTSSPGGTLTRRFTSVTGTTATNDVTLLYTYFIPLNNSLAIPVLSASTGAPQTSTDSATAQGNWLPLDPTDPPTLATSNTDSHVLIDRSLATQKSVVVVTDTGATGPSPGDTLEYTINFQVSDYFAFQNLSLSDVISDGQHFDSSFTPTLQVNGNPFALGTANFNAANFSVTGNYTGAIPAPTTPDGTSIIAFRLSNEMITRGQNGQLLGGMVTQGGGSLQTAPGDGPTTGTVKFRTVIQARFTNNFPSGEPSVNHGDHLSDLVTAQGDVVSIATLAPTGSTVTDTSSATVIIVSGTLIKSIYAVNGSSSFSTPVKVAAGDSVTYRLQYTLPTSDEEQLSLSDFLPLPVFTASSVGTFDDTGYSSTATVIPTSGHANFGPADTFRPLSSTVPTLTSNGTSNSLKFAYPNYKDPTNSSTTIDLLFTVTVSNQPFADGLFLTNQAHAIEGTTNATPTASDAIVQILLTEPVLNITKGVIATDNVNAVLTGTPGPVSFSAPGSAGYRGSATIHSNGLGATPIRAGISKIDAGDLVTFALVVENKGSGLNGAFNVRLRDVMPTGFTTPGGGLNLTVTDGTGAMMSVTDLGGGLFGTGLELADPGPTASPAGSLDPFSTTNGRNIMVLTFDLLSTSTVTPKQHLDNTASLFNYASQAGGANFLNTPLTATASVTTADVSLTKSLTATNQAFTTGPNLTIGEVGTYSITATIPEGVTPSALLADALPTGMALVSLDTLTSSSGALSFSSGTLEAILAAATVGAGGSSISLNFGSITNTDIVNTTAETVTLVYRAVVLNVAGNINGTTLTNSARLNYTGGGVNTNASVTAVVPAIQVVKTVDNANAQAGDTVTYTMIISHASRSGADAFDVNLSDIIPANLTYVGGSLQNTAGLVPTTIGQAAGSVTATFATFTKTDTSTIVFQALVGGGVAGLSPVVNTVKIAYSTLPGTANPQISTYNANSHERTGDLSDPGGSVNNLVTSGSATIIPPLGITKVVLGTNQGFTAGNNVAIGEQVQYRVSLTVTQGTTPGASLVDTLPSGLAILSLDSITASPNVSTSIAGGFAGVLTNAVVGSSGGSVTFDLGTLTNTDNDSGTPETVVLTYTAVVLNTVGNQNGTTLTNSATFTVPSGTRTTSAPALTVVAPVLRVTESLSSTTGDAGGAPITFTVVVSHTGASMTDAYDVSLSDLVPVGFTLVGGSFMKTAGTTPTSITQSGNTLTAGFSSFVLIVTSTFTFQATLNSTTTPGQVLTNTPSITYTTLPGTVTTAQSTYNSVSTERTGLITDPGGAVNNLITNVSASVTVNTNSLAGFVYVDANNDGTKQGSESAISGVTINLGGIDNLGNAISLTTTTSGTGDYHFTGLRPGSYTISEVQPLAYLDGKDTVGTPFGGSNATNDTFSIIAIPTGTNAAGANYNFGELSPAGVTGTVFSDLNNDGVKQGGEAGISGATVTLMGTNDLGQSVNISLTTNGSGVFSFTSLRPGLYTLTETQPTGYLDGKDSAGNTAGTLSNDTVTNFTLISGQSDSGVTFGELAPASLGGSVYHDANNDGVKQAGESGINGVFVALTGTDDLGNLVNLITTTSGGLYSFTNLRPSNAAGYTITETQPAAFPDGKNTIGTPGGVATVNDVFSGIFLTAGVNGINNNFGELIPASLAGFVYEDVNNDGVKQAGESGITGVTVALSGVDDLGTSVTATVVTTASGAYNFTGLRPGTYALTETQPTVYVDGRDTAGSPGGSTSTKNSITGIALGSSIAGVNNNFGERATADLSLTKTVDNATPNVGQNVTFTITLRNTGPDDATNVVVSDLLPTGLSFISSIPSQGSYNNITGLWTVGTVTNGSTKTLTVIALVVSPSARTNTGTVSASDQSDPTSANNTANATETPRLSDLGVTQAISNPTPNVGDTITFTTVLTNNGPDTGTGISVSIPLPSGLTYISSAPSQGGFNSATGLWTIGTLANGASVTLTVAVLVAGPNPKTDTATISAADQYDTVAANNTASVIEIPQQADLALSKSVSNATPNVGDVIIFTITLSNNGPSAATNVTANDLLPSGLTFLSATPSQGIYSSLTGIWTVGMIASGASKTMTIAATVVSPNPLINNAGVAHSDQYDPNNANNAASASETPQQANLSLLKMVDNGSPRLGSLVTFTIHLSNRGPDTATNVTVSDLLPAGLTFSSAIPSQGSYSSATGIWTVGAVATGQGASLAVVALVTGSGLKTNLAQVLTSDQFDPNSTPGNSNPAEDDQASVIVTPLSSLAGSVFVDFNNDGARQNAEPGIPGVTLTLNGTDDLSQPVNRTTMTGPDGSYLFDNLRPGTYRLIETQPPAYSNGTDAVGTAAGTLGSDVVTAIPLGAGVVATGYTFGELGATLSGTVFNDSNKNGSIEGGETGFSGVTVTLENGDGNIVASAQTAADGAYHFDNLPIGPYRVVSTPPLGYGQSSPITVAVNLPLVGLTGQNFGETTASLAGFVYIDTSNDGLFQPAESGLNGAIVTLTGTDATGSFVSRTGATSPDGSYAFPNLLSGTYAITLTPPTGFLDGKRTIGTPGGTTGQEAFTGVVLGIGVSGINNNFGELVPASLAGFVYSDANDDGLKQPSELPVSGVTLRLTGTDDLGQPVSTTTTTNPDGSYNFGTLRPGNYTVTLTHPTGVLGGTNAVGSQGGTVAGTALSGLVLGSGTQGVNNNFAVLNPALLSGLVFLDNNNDGIRQPREIGLAGVTVTLTGTDDQGHALSVGLTTGADGSYNFTGLRPGTYVITETQPTLYGDGKVQTGSAGGTVGINVISGVTLIPGQSAANNTFGERDSTITGLVYLDLNGDQTHQPGEPGIGGVTVTLLDATGHTVATTTTNPDGSYTFTNLPSGDFTLQFDQLHADGSHSTTTKLVYLASGAISNQSINVDLSNSSLSGSVFSDLNNDGIRSVNEAGIAGVVVFLKGIDSAGNAIVRTTTTVADGGYTFSRLPSGTYTITETQPTGYLDGKDSAGTSGGLAGNDLVTGANLGIGAAATAYNFGELLPSSLSGSVYLEYVNNGIRDANEFGIANVSVTLSGLDDQGRPVTRTATTDDNGSFTINNIRPGLYTVSAQGPKIFIDGVGSHGPVRGSGKDIVSNIQLQAGQTATEYTFGKIARPGCRLGAAQFRAALQQGPNGPVGVVRRPSIYKPMPTIQHWIPKLAARFGYVPAGTQSGRALHLQARHVWQ